MLRTAIIYLSIVALLFSLYFFIWEELSGENKEIECISEINVVEITSVKHRTAFFLMDDGNEYSISQPRDLKVGNTYCLTYKVTNTNDNTTMLKENSFLRKVE